MEPRSKPTVNGKITPDGYPICHFRSLRHNKVQAEPTVSIVLGECGAYATSTMPHPSGADRSSMRIVDAGMRDRIKMIVESGCDAKPFRCRFSRVSAIGADGAQFVLGQGSKRGTCARTARRDSGDWLQLRQHQSVSCLLNKSFAANTEPTSSAIREYPRCCSACVASAQKRLEEWPIATRPCSHSTRSFTIGSLNEKRSTIDHYNLAGAESLLH